MSELRVKGEPEIVWKTRDLILDRFKDLQFIEEGHKYYLNGKELPSVSAVTHQFAQPFDVQKTSINYAKKHGKSPEYWRDLWRYKNLIATTSGTEIHLFGECMTYLRMGHPELLPETMRKFYIPDCGWLIPTRAKEEAILKYFSEMYIYDYPVLAETKVYNNFNPEIPKMKTDYCGTFDILYYRFFPKEPEKSGFVIKDYKGLPLDTIIATKQGWTTMKDIKVGDQVFDKDGELCTVTGTSKIHNNPCYKITLNTGETFIADEEHRWLIGDKVLQTKELTTDMKIIVAKNLNLPKIELPSDPYDFGVRLSEIKPNEELPDVMPWLRSSFADRLSILKGAVDTIGNFDPAFGIIQLGSKNKEIIDILEELMFTLGVVPNRNEGYTYKKEEYIYYLECMGLDIIDGINYNSNQYRIITNIEKTETVETRCIEVDSPSHTYCFGKSLIVTHNTNKELTKDYSRQHNKMCLKPFLDLFDEPLSMYTLQLSCYQIPLMDLGVKIIDREIIWLKEDKNYEVIKLPDMTQKLREVL